MYLWGPLGRWVKERGRKSRQGEPSDYNVDLTQEKRREESGLGRKGLKCSSALRTSQPGGCEAQEQRLPREQPHVGQECLSSSKPTVLSHWQEASWEEHGFHVNAVADSKGAAAEVSANYTPPGRVPGKGTSEGQTLMAVM